MIVELGPTKLFFKVKLVKKGATVVTLSSIQPVIERANTDLCCRGHIQCPSLTVEYLEILVYLIYGFMNL